MNAPKSRKLDIRSLLTLVSYHILMHNPNKTVAFIPEL